MTSRAALKEVIGRTGRASAHGPVSAQNVRWRQISSCGRDSSTPPKADCWRLIKALLGSGEGGVREVNARFHHLPNAQPVTWRPFHMMGYVEMFGAT